MTTVQLTVEKVKTVVPGVEIECVYHFTFDDGVKVCVEPKSVEEGVNRSYGKKKIKLEDVGNDVLDMALWHINEARRELTGELTEKR